mmetsp:Transcript_16283/g.53210  ORF Transcript_16283/g.53210 Transcript_16283/m.53210 type:complete len:240 (+) Transcript_16283:1048-1767(+)
MPRLCQENRGVQGPAGGAAPRPGHRLRAAARRPVRYALPRRAENLQAARVQPPRRDEHARHPVPGEEAPALQLRGCEGAGMGPRERHQVHQGGGRPDRPGRAARGSQERHGAQDFHRQRLPHLAHQAHHLHPLPRSQQLAAEGGGRRRKHERLRLQSRLQGAPLRGVERQQRGVEHRHGGHVLLLGERHAQHQDGRFPDPPAEAPRVRGWVQRVENFLPALCVHADDRRPAERLALPLR